MKNNINLIPKCTISMTPFEKYTNQFTMAYFFFSSHNFRFFALNLITGFLFFGFPLLFAYMIYLSGQLEYLFLPILFSLFTFLILIGFYFFYKIYLIISSKDFIPPWERFNIGNIFHIILIIIPLFLFFHKCSLCLNENVAIDDQEEKKDYANYVSPLSKFVFILIINGNNYENELERDNILKNEVFNIDDKKNKIIIDILFKMLFKVITPLIFLGFYLMMKIILIKTIFTIEKLLILMSSLFEIWLIYFGKKEIQYSNYNFLFIILMVLIIKGKNLYKIGKRYQYNPVNLTSTGEELSSFFDSIIVLFFELFSIFSYIFFAVSFYYIIFLGSENEIIKGKLIFNLGSFLFFIGNTYLTGNFIVMLVFSPIKKAVSSPQLKQHYVKIYYSKKEKKNNSVILSLHSSMEKDEDTSTLLSYND